MTTILAADTPDDLAPLWPQLPALAACNPYRFHRLFSAEEQVAILRAGIERTLAGERRVVRLLVAGGTVRGCCAISALPWDSAHFGVAMGRLDGWFAPGTAEDAVLALLAATLEAAAPLAIRHLSTHVDADDYAQFRALSRLGFALVDAKRTFVARRHQRPRRGSRIVAQPRAYRAADRAQVEALVAGSQFASRFTRDATLDPARSHALYRLWMNRLLDFPAERRALFVVERDAEIVACGGVVEMDFSAAGVDKRILGDGVFACSRRGVGSYHSVIDALIADGIGRYPLLETKVSVNNTAAVRVLESLGYSTANSQYALHRHG